MHAPHAPGCSQAEMSACEAALRAGSQRASPRSTVASVGCPLTDTYSGPLMHCLPLRSQVPGAASARSTFPAR